jgi:hypothetical protein
MDWLTGIQWWDIVGLAGTVVTIIGLLINIARTNATKAAVDRAQKRLLSNQVLFLIPKLQLIETSLDESVRSKVRDGAITGLVDWRNEANLLRGFLTSIPNSGELRELLQGSNVLAIEAKSALVASKTASLVRTTEAIRASMAQVNDAAIEFAATIGLQAGDSNV